MAAMPQVLLRAEKTSPAAMPVDTMCASPQGLRSSVAVGPLCSKPNGRPSRPFHLVRRLAGADGLKEYVVEATNFSAGKRP
jgi:hypothetical protein